MAEPNLRTLTALRRYRHIETDEARRDLAEALAHEADLTARETGIVQRIDQARHTAGDFDREAFVAWLTRMRVERDGLADAMRTAAARTAGARLALANRRMAETAAEEAVATVAAGRETGQARRDQAMLEDTARAIAGGGAE